MKGARKAAAFVGAYLLAAPWGGSGRVLAADEAKDHRGGAATAAEQPAGAPSSRALMDQLNGVGAQPSREAAAGEIFGMPVSLGNYYFAKRVAYTFPRPWGASDVPAKEREPLIWESLILNYEAFRRAIDATDEEIDSMVNELLSSQHLPYTRRGDPDAYRRWVVETLYEDTPGLENQVRFLIQIRKLKDQARAEQVVSVTEADMQEEFLNEKHHLGGETVTFETKPEAEAFYQQVKAPADWDRMKAEGKHQIRPVSLMTVEAYVDLWGIPRDQLIAFHAMPLGSVGPPMPFGKQWCVYHLLDKRTGDLKDFPAARDSYRAQVEQRKRYEALARWVDTLKTSAALKVFVPSG